MHRGVVWMWATSLLDTSLRSRQVSARLLRTPSRTLKCLRIDSTNGSLKMSMSTSSVISKSTPLAMTGRNDSVTLTQEKDTERIHQETSTGNKAGEENDVDLEDTSPFPALLESAIVKSQSVDELLQVRKICIVLYLVYYNGLA